MTGVNMSYSCAASVYDWLRGIIREAIWQYRKKRYPYQSFAPGPSLRFVLLEVAPAAAEAKLDVRELDMLVFNGRQLGGKSSRVEGRVRGS